MSEIIYTGKETLQPLATKIKTLGGVEDSITLAEMENSVKAANEGLAAQATTIAEIAALLEGKSVPGGGGNLKIFVANVEAQQTQCGNYRLTYMCPLDQLDFSAITIDNLTIIHSSVSEGGYVEVFNVFDAVNAEVGVAVKYRVKNADETIYSATTLELIMYMPEYNYESPMYAFMAKITPEVIAAAGLSIEPGVYMTNPKGAGLTLIYTGP